MQINSFFFLILAQSLGQSRGIKASGLQPVKTEPGTGTSELVEASKGQVQSRAGSEPGPDLAPAPGSQNWCQASTNSLLV